MKKFLSLVLALVMTMSLVTISAGAKTFEDDAAIDYTEAVEVMKGIGVIDGYADGSFNPNATLTRGAAAKIICNMILGPTNAGALAVTAAPFKDVPADNVFAGYISYCVSEGIVSGYADGTFRPAGTLTGYAFMKMLLGALGSDTAAEGYSGIPSWSVNVAKRALNIGLDDGLTGSFNGTKAVTRQEACLYAFNTLKADMVEYDNDSTITVGDIVIASNSKAKPVTANGTTNKYNSLFNEYAENGNSGENTQQFAEKYFPKLDLDAAATDAYGRPANEWEYGKDTIGTYVKTPALVYTTGVKGTVMATDIDDADLDIADSVSLTVNSYKVGADVASDFEGALTAKTDVEYTGKGVQFELYTNAIDEIDQIVVIYTVLGQVTAVGKDKASTTTVDESYLTVDVDNFNGVLPVKAYAEKSSTNVKAIGFAGAYAAVAKDDYVMVVPKVSGYSHATTFTWGDGNFYTVANGDVIAIAVPETVKGVMTYKNTSTASVKIDGTSYNMAYNFGDDTAFCAVSDKQVVAYVDAYGNLLMIDGVSSTADKSVAVLDVYQALNKDGKIVPMIKGVTSNGETVNWQVHGETEQLAGAVYTYTEDSSVYTLTDLTTPGDLYDTDDDTVITKAQAGATYKVTLDTDITTSTKKICTYENLDDVDLSAYNYFADTVNFIFVNDNGTKVTATVKEGVQKVDAGEKLAIVINDDGEISTVYVLAAAKNSIDTSDALILIAEKTGSVSVYNKATEDYDEYYTYNAYVNGEKVEDFYATKYDNVTPGTFYKNELDADTGAYVLTGNEFDGDDDYGVKSQTLSDTTWYINSKIVKINGVDLSITGKTVVADDTGNEITSVAALKNAFDSREIRNADVAALYDAETGEALYIYVVDVA